uniref:Rap-GAP domain-containing protein n=1 Tax=Anabas testudineus TaxID=64144 RepID=A0A7N6A7H2_ANATE
MEKEKKNDISFSRKRSFTFGAYGGMDRFTCGDETRLETAENNILDILDSPTNENKPFRSANSNQRDTELFEIIEKLQGSRIDEQRCEFPLPLKVSHQSENKKHKAESVHERSPEHFLPQTRPNKSRSSLSSSPFYDIMERDGEAKIYHEFFRSRVSKLCSKSQETYLLCCTYISHLFLFPVPSLFHSSGSIFRAPGSLCAPELITAFDEHRVSPNFKFGILYQKEGQLTEEDILSNTDESEEFKEFLSHLGETIQLQGFTGFRGGLDVCHGQTGSQAVFTSFHGREIMFHVATKLPFTEGDPQQLQRKRHIGNDIVALVYQEGKTPFLSDVIKSHFLHCFLVVRRLQRAEEMDGAAYQVSVTAREDVPPFGPVLPDPPVFKNCSLLREFLLTKLINAEISCYKAERFSKLELRTRSSLLESLQVELSTRSQCMLGEPSLSALPSSEGARGASEGSGGFIENFKRAIRVRSHSFETLGVPRKTGGSGAQKPKVKL